MSVRERCDCVVPELSPRDSVSRVTCLLVTTCSVFTERVSRPPGPRPVSWPSWEPCILATAGRWCWCWAGAASLFLRL